MIYLQSDTMKTLILEPGNLRLLEQGHPVLSPDRSVAIFYTPDAEWLEKKLSTAAKADRLDAETLSKLLTEGLTREPVDGGTRAHFPTRQIVKDGEPI